MLFGMQAKYGLIQKRGDWKCSIRHAYLQLSLYLLLQFELHDYFSLLTYSFNFLHLFFSVWIGSTNLAVSHLSAPFLVALCRRKSVRLTAVVGGLVMTLSLLFASFAKHFDQIFLRYVPISCKKSLTICRTITCQLDFGVINLPNLLNFCLKQQLVPGFF